jgi:hypothetical protein
MYQVMAKSASKGAEDNPNVNAHQSRPAAAFAVENSASLHA